MLSQSDPLPARPQRVVVAGVSGVGKSTLALRIADVLGLPYTEIDALFHGNSKKQFIIFSSVYRNSCTVDIEFLAYINKLRINWQFILI